MIKEQQNRLSCSDDLDVVIVTHNSGRTISQCIKSVRGHLSGCRIIVVDSGSSDESEIESLEAGADIIKKVPNKGFGAACNEGASLGSSKWILFLNPDAIICFFDESILQSTSDIIVPELYSREGNSRPSAFRYPTLLKDVLGEFGFIGHRNNRFMVENSWISGACILVRRDAFESIKGFDPQFFLFREDTDLCLRLRKAGYNFAIGKLIFSHSGGESTDQHPDARSLARMHSRLIYARKVYGRFGYSIMGLSILISGLIKFLMSLIVNNKDPKIYSTAIKLVLLYHCAPAEKLKTAWLDTILSLMDN